MTREEQRNACIEATEEMFTAAVGRHLVVWEKQKSLSEPARAPDVEIWRTMATTGDLTNLPKKEYFALDPNANG